MITFVHYTYLVALLFSIGLIGVLRHRKNLIGILMSMELMLLAINLHFVAASSLYHHLTGQVMTLFALTVTAAESAIGLAIIVVFFRNRNNISLADDIRLKG